MLLTTYHSFSSLPSCGPFHQHSEKKLVFYVKLCNYTNQFQNAVLGCPCTRHMINTFFDLLIYYFVVHLHIELSQLDEELMYFVLLGGVEPTQYWLKTNKNNFFAFVQKLLAVQQHNIVELLHNLCKAGCL